MTPLLAQKSQELSSSIWGRIGPMRELKENCPEIIGIADKADIIASVLMDIAGLEDPTLTSREAVQAQAKHVQKLLTQLNQEMALLLA